MKTSLKFASLAALTAATLALPAAAQDMSGAVKCQPKTAAKCGTKKCAPKVAAKCGATKCGPKASAKCGAKKCAPKCGAKCSPKWGAKN
ncbi:hypothetical protein GCM10010975_05680 [Comamonas phosphati]|nr:hypothetical protein GCM10010975_05680 [Comamonas phosphati]